jgi:8-oxo-dGTP pyrophosphatase MutT (NUDIX family)
LLVADDVLGGSFAINGGALPGPPGRVHYFAPDALEWEDLDRGYSDFLAWTLAGDLEKFYQGYRWPGWSAEVQALPGDRAFSIHPFLWAEGPPITERSRRVVPMAELFTLQLDLKRQLSTVERMPSDLSTWDGRRRAAEPPFGASVIVHRLRESRREFLLLHRAHGGPEYEGDWAWTPPSGARLPGEAVEICALRELREEAGLSVSIRPVPGGSPDWTTFEGEVGSDMEPVLVDPEHDRFEWVPLDEALRRCLPAPVAEAFQRVADLLDA